MQVSSSRVLRISRYLLIKYKLSAAGMQVSSSRVLPVCFNIHVCAYTKYHVREFVNLLQCLEDVNKNGRWCQVWTRAHVRVCARVCCIINVCAYTKHHVSKHMSLLQCTSKIVIIEERLMRACTLIIRIFACAYVHVCVWPPIDCQ